jgi:nitroimidazol reductase NimA-like FMN-containing flavoprotein (pyridoxamine 5'-phosphate oxidase superfamily)
VPPTRETVDPGKLTPEQIDELLERRLIAKLATVDARGNPHLVAMWFRRDGDAILMPTSGLTRKVANLRRHPAAAVLIDDNRSGLDLRGVHVRGPIEIVEGEEARALNRSIHLRYVTERALTLGPVTQYLVEGDDVTLRLRMERVTSWNIAGREVGRAVLEAGEFHELDSR